jgi:hypothetical protein
MSTVDVLVQYPLASVHHKPATQHGIVALLSGGQRGRCSTGPERFVSRSARALPSTGARHVMRISFRCVTQWRPGIPTGKRLLYRYLIHWLFDNDGALSREPDSVQWEAYVMIAEMAVTLSQ